MKQLKVLLHFLKTITIMQSFCLVNMDMEINRANLLIKEPKISNPMYFKKLEPKKNTVKTEHDNTMFLKNTIKVKNDGHKNKNQEKSDHDFEKKLIKINNQIKSYLLKNRKEMKKNLERKKNEVDNFPQKANEFLHKYSKFKFDPNVDISKKNINASEVKIFKSNTESEINQVAESLKNINIIKDLIEDIKTVDMEIFYLVKKFKEFNEIENEVSIKPEEINEISIT